MLRFRRQIGSSNRRDRGQAYGGRDEKGSRGDHGITVGRAKGTWLGHIRMLGAGRHQRFAATVSEKGSREMWTRNPSMDMYERKLQ